MAPEGRHNEIVFAAFLPTPWNHRHDGKFYPRFIIPEDRPRPDQRAHPRVDEQEPRGEANLPEDEGVTDNTFNIQLVPPDEQST